MKNKKIPNNIILTWKDHTVPNYVFDNIKQLNPDTNIVFFEDKDCRKFLRETYNENFVTRFDSETCGCHKADFFRYAYLYDRGGYYTDVDIEYNVPIDDFVGEDTEFFSIISAMFSTHIFQAILYVTPKHRIIKNCLNDMLLYGPNMIYLPGGYKNAPPYTGAPTERMYQNYLNYTKTNGTKYLRLGNEMNMGGRYGCVYNNTCIAWSRYETFNRECFTDWKDQ